MELDLVDDRCLTRLLNQTVEMLGHKVRDADGADPPVLFRLDKGTPRLDVFVLFRVRPMQQEQVPIVEIRPVERLTNHLERIVVVEVLGAKLGRQKQLLARDAGLPDGFADRSFIVIANCRIDETIAVADSARDGVDARFTS